MSDQGFVKLKAVLSTNIKSMRKSKGIAQERLGLDSGVDRTLVSKIERELANPSLEILHKLATCLETTVADLLATSKTRSKHPGTK